ncbi:MAG TPA: hypothetical protein VK277_06575 [Acidimicrobiales bacterium]|nr:hypothetical protein [Acidimicrobiales bacterium]
MAEAPMRKIRWALAGALVLVLALGFGGWWVWGRSLGCGWPMRVSGDASRGPVGAVNCYLRYEAEDDRAGLATVMVQNGGGPPGHVTDTDLRYSADARKGVARVSFKDSEISTSVVYVKITYADGVVQNTAAESEAAFGMGTAWKVDFGSN